MEETSRSRNCNKLTIHQQSKRSSGIQLAHAGRKASVSAPWNGNKKLDVTQGVGKLWLHQQ
jgi:2,4-dienoyl-CoA reductase-like NADH-dependent reductase (Old Yellow Enzyme family)